MQKLLRALDEDKEVQQMKKEWKEKMTIPFPGYNYDEYGGIDDYKQKIRERLNKS
jgi:hypothetical protein